MIFTKRYRYRFGDIDYAGIAYYPSYFHYFHCAFEDWWSEGLHAPYDVVLFVGLSSWLPKPQTARHMRWVRGHIRSGGVLVSDSFTPEAYALSGRYVGYKAHYYTPDIYRAFMDFCGFDGLSASVDSGRDGINHVMLFEPRQDEGGAGGSR